MKSFNRSLTFIIFFLSLLLQGCYVLLYDGLKETDANEMLALLLEENISASTLRDKTGVSLSIDSNYVAHAIRILHNNGLPRQKFARFGDIFKSDSLISSPTQEQAKMIYALSEEISRTLSYIDGVLVARAHVVLVNTSVNNEVISPASVAIFLKYREGANIEKLMPQIRMLVVNSIPGLTMDKVTVFPFSSKLKVATAQVTLEDGLSKTGYIIGVFIMIIILLAGGGAFWWFKYRKKT